MKQHTVASIRAGLLAKEFSSVELTREALAHAERENPATNAYLRFSPERALAAAEKVDEKIAAGHDPGTLGGVPVAVKDVIVTKGVVTTCGSKFCAITCRPTMPPRLNGLRRRAESSSAKQTATSSPWGRRTKQRLRAGAESGGSRPGVPGGSSGGSAAVVAQGTAVVSLGSDTGGSVRQPASFCGVVGVTPTYGRVSRYGLVAFASSLDHIGPFARNVRDAATLLEVIAGRDPLDSTSADAPVPNYAAHLDGDVRGMKIGVPIEYMKHATGDTADRVNEAIESLRAMGCEVRDVSLPSTDYAIAAYYVIATAEASSNLARFDGVRYTMRSAQSDTLSNMYQNTRGEGFGAEVKRRIMLGTYVLSHGYYDAYYLKAQKVRALIAQDFSNAFQEVDAIAAPVSPYPAFRIGEKVDDPVAMYLSDIYTITGSLAGIPCMSVPCGTTAEGLPVGLQILCKHFDELKMFRLADAFEKR
jgi:aspartyl-tRNA(Asn)/glutamyl-tRNA(Gln) amidotransferase subunit A